MKRVIILHGTNTSPTEFWYPFIKKRLKERGYDVWVPNLPNAKKADINDWLPFVLNNGNIDKNTILIGHSAGSPLILSILERIDFKIRQAILVAGFLESNSKILQSSYNWEKIKQNINDIIFINSDDDPWGCNDKQGRALFDKLGGTLIIRHGEGHMGSTEYKQPYTKFPFLLNLVE